jgi:predicted regulator of Ras-like GTPase activity (Roadblock/LC7/MglB family)
MVTRQSELLRVLGDLAGDLPDPIWVALVDDDGLIMACVPQEPPINPDQISAMTAAAVIMGDRALEEVEGGELRYITISGADRQIMNVAVGEGRWLSIGLLPQVRAQATFAPLSKGMPDVVKILNMRITSQDTGVVAL